MFLQELLQLLFGDTLFFLLGADDFFRCVLDKFAVGKLQVEHAQIFLLVFDFGFETGFFRFWIDEGTYVQVDVHVLHDAIRHVARFHRSVGNGNIGDLGKSLHDVDIG